MAQLKEKIKRSFFIELATLCSNQSLPLLIGGNINIMRFSYENNKELRKTRRDDILNQVINLYDLREIVMTRGLFTWSNIHKNPNFKN
jgi:hypothetical protein